MNDINYVIILKVKVTHVQNNISNTYFSRLGSGFGLLNWKMIYRINIMESNYNIHKNGVKTYFSLITIV